MTNAEQTKTAGQLPFGLRYAGESRSGTKVDIDWSTIGYDPRRQIATVTEDGVTMPLISSDSATAVRSTSTSTTTSYGTSEGTEFDSQSDWD
ncbi:hypothetical protein [Streptomyces sp. AC550_RSS872]|uniref:hypothetical protein n=1 Tax=Streptomyces sp. AC550_RSS872 TaxID=2823689 RepID=UPI001C2759BA|nr:hypothetical protein [Streptomyces sp. AC550_RSS872]